MPKQLYLVKLHFNSPLHIARGRSDYSESERILRSDTLKSALFVVAKLLYGDDKLGENGTRFFENFKLSSAFPFWNDLLFFPRPKMDLSVFFNSKIEFKNQKKIEWLDKNSFEDFLNNRPGIWKEDMLIDKKRMLTKYAFGNKKEKDQFRIIHEEVFQHVSVPRAGGTDSDTYYMERLYFVKNAGLFFLLEFENENIKSIVEHALHLLSEEGIGSDRNTGNGQFDPPKLEPFQFDVIDAPSHSISLSLFCPQKEELAKTFIEGASYSLTQRGGYITSSSKSENTTLLKKPIYMFSEGSLFPGVSLNGQLANLQPSSRGRPPHLAGRQAIDRSSKNDLKWLKQPYVL